MPLVSTVDPELIKDMFALIDTQKKRRKKGTYFGTPLSISDWKLESSRRSRLHWSRYFVSHSSFLCWWCIRLTTLKKLFIDQRPKDVQKSLNISALLHHQKGRLWVSCRLVRYACLTLIHAVTRGTARFKSEKVFQNKTKRAKGTCCTHN